MASTTAAKKTAPARNDDVILSDGSESENDETVSDLHIIRVNPLHVDGWTLPRFKWEDHIDELDRKEREVTEAWRRANPRFKKSNVVCTHWLRGLCTYLDFECPNLHVYDSELFPICRFYIRGDGSCTNPECIFRHPGRDEEVLCVDYARGFCKDGERCDYTHQRHPESERPNIRHHVNLAITSRRREQTRSRKRREQDRKQNTERIRPDQRRMSTVHRDYERSVARGFERQQQQYDEDERTEEEKGEERGRKRTRGVERVEDRQKETERTHKRHRTNERAPQGRPGKQPHYAQRRGGGGQQQPQRPQEPEGHDSQRQGQQRQGRERAPPPRLGSRSRSRSQGRGEHGGRHAANDGAAVGHKRGRYNGPQARGNSNNNNYINSNNKRVKR